MLLYEESLAVNGVNTEEHVALTVQGCLRYWDEDVRVCSSGLIGLCVSD